MRRAAPELAAVTSVLAAFACDAALAQAMTDPTRPPVEHAAPEGRAPAAPSEPVLQSVLITPTLKAAIINGEMVKLGDMFGSAQLVKVTESEVVLKSGNEMQVLKMYPGVEKRESAKTTPRRTQQKPVDVGPGGSR